MLTSLLNKLIPLSKKIWDRLQPSPIKTPVILQMEATECGAAALGIILAYHERYVSLAELRTECGVSRDGSKAINMLKAARRYGLSARAAKIEEWETITQLTLPCIVFWEFDHFIVVEGVRGDYVYVNDPAIGRRTISTDEFDRSFTGVVLVFEPEPNFEKGGKQFSSLETIKERIIPYRDAITYIILVSLGLVIPGIIIPGFSKIFIDDILIANMHQWILPLLFGMLLTAVLRSIFTWFLQTRLLRLQTQLLLTTSVQFLWHVLRLPINFFYQRYVGDIDARLAANDRVAHILSGDVTSSIVSLLTIVFYAIVMLFISWPLALIGIFITLVNATLFYYVSQYLSDVNYRLVQEQGKLVGVEMNGLQIIETLKASAAEDAFFQRWAGYHARIINSQQHAALYSLLLESLPQLLSGLTTVIILGLGSWQVMQGQLSLGSLVAFQSLLASFNAPVFTLLGLGTEIQEIRGDFARLNDVLQHPEDPRFKLNDKAISPTAKIEGTLEVNDISFGYSPLDPPLIENFNLTLKPGERIAIVGATGSGKSTVAKLITGLYQPWSGTIRLNKQPIGEISPALFANSIALVDQESSLFEGSVRDNVTLWDKKIPDSIILQALGDASISDVIKTRNDGIDSYVAENGSNFSGGQRQRLEIARALVTKPAILILDEATSDLDAMVEEQIYSRLKEQKYTMLIIAHRLSTIKDCDQILVLDHGKLIQQGTHQELMAQEGLYQQLYQADS